MEIQKIYIGENDTVVVRCPKCKETKAVPALKLKDKHRFKVRCSCKAVFDVHLEFRKQYRKETNLDGFFEKLSEPDKWGDIQMESISSGSHALKCRIKNISVLGIGFSSNATHKLEKGDHIKLIFTLDDSVSSKVEKKAVVRGVSGNYVGCEFFESDKHNPRIGFYVL